MEGTEASLQLEKMTHKAHSSTASWKSLKLISIPEMVVGLPTVGFLLVVRSIEDVYISSGLHVTVEDHAGNVLPLTVSNYVKYKEDQNEKDHIPMGSIFALKEPTVRLRNKMRVIYCDSPTDFFILTASHPLVLSTRNTNWLQVDRELPQTVWEIRELSTRLYREKKYRSSIEMDLRALDRVNATDFRSLFLVFLHLAHKHLETGFYESAFKFAEKALELEPENQNANYIAARACYELRQYVKSEKYFQKMRSYDPKNRTAIEELERCSKRLEEGLNGVTADRLFLDSSSDPCTRLDCADYVGPVKRKPQTGGTRGIVATENISPGTLLVVSKALAVHFNERELGDISPLDEDLWTRTGIAKLSQDVCQSVTKNPITYGGEVYDLPVDDAFLDCLKPKLFCTEDKKEACIDMERIGLIVASNSVPLQLYSNDSRTIGLGFFSFPSYFQHSCLASAHAQTFNDVMVIHAIRPIKVGEEITLTFLDPETNFTVRQEKLLEKETVCTCRLCKLDSEETYTLRKKRELLVDQANAQFRNLYLSRAWNMDDVEDFSVLVKSIEITYGESGRSEMLFSVAKPFTCMAYLYGSVKDYSQSVTYAAKAIAALGFNADILNSWSENNYLVAPEDALFTRSLFLPFSILAGVWNAMNVAEESEKFLTYILLAEKVLSGAGPSMLKVCLERYSSESCY